MAKAWSIKIATKKKFSDADRDFIAELVSEEARKTIKKYSFILNEIIESKDFCQIFVEGNRFAYQNLLSVVKDNLPLGKAK